jgi:hypothetical protein
VSKMGLRTLVGVGRMTQEGKGPPETPLVTRNFSDGFIITMERPRI